MTPRPGHPPELRPLLARLQAAGLAEDATQLLDALWLSRWLPGPVAAIPATAEEPLPEDNAAAGKAPPTPPAQPPARARDAGPEVDVPLPTTPPPEAPADAGVYARAGGPTADDAWRARALRVAGVPALRDGPALARALRPLGKRRRSATRFVIDEAATAERLADTGLLSPVLVPERERFFSATLLVEDSAALPLWRGLADELETLLARQGGFRHFRRLALVTDGPQLQLRSRSGALQSPRMLLEDDASLVLIATDGTSTAWSDGRMAALAALLGPRTCVAALQWMPERLWPHSALGAADLGVQAPRPGAPLAELRLTRPRWLRPHRPVLPMPVAALTPASLGRLATMLMAKPGVRGAAALLWPTPTVAAAPAEEEDLAQLSPEQRISRFRAVGSARLLQAAVQLSAAAPLTLPVVRLVHRVMQPGAPTEDLPLLLLGGLLQRQPAPPAEAATGGDDDVVFDFAPGVRQALQAALLKHEADAVRRAVSGYIAERTGSPIDLQALVRDDQGALQLPAWARPFAEVTRQVQALYRPPQPPAKAPAVQAPPSVREQAWAPGVTMQAETALPAPARKLAWSPDGQRLAVLHQQGVATFRLQPTGPGQRRWQREPLAMRGPSTVFLVQGFDVAQPDFQAAVHAFQAAWPTLFNQPLQLQFHTVGAAFGQDLPRRPDDDLRQLMSRVERQEALMLCVGGTRFFQSAWAQAAQKDCLSRFDLQARMPVLSLRSTPAAAKSATASADFKLMQLFEGQAVARMTSAGPADAGRFVAELLADQAPRYLSQVATGPTATDLLWTTDGRLLVADGLSGEVLDADTGTTVDRAPPSWDRQHPLLLAQRPGAISLTLARGQDFNVDLPEAASLQSGSDRMEAPIAEMAWSSNGLHLALRLANGTVRFLSAGERPAAVRRFKPLQDVACGPAWQSTAEGLAYAVQQGDMVLRDAQGDKARWQIPAGPRTLSWSPDDRLLACGLARGRIQLTLQPATAAKQTVMVRTGDDDADVDVQLAFCPHAPDDSFEALAVAAGRSLTLLRVAPEALAPEQPQQRPPLPTQEEVLEAACQVLHAIATAFVSGALAPAGQEPVADRYARLLNLPPDATARAELDHLIERSARLFGTDLPPCVLEGAPDPLAWPDLDAGAAHWQDWLTRMAQALATLTVATSSGTTKGTLPPSAAQPANAMADLQRGLRELRAMLNLLNEDEQATWQSATSLDARRWLQALAPLQAPELRNVSGSAEPLLRVSGLLSGLQAALSRLQQEPIASLMAAPAARADWLHAGAALPGFEDCHQLHDYELRFTRLLADHCESLADAARPTRLLVMPSVPSRALKVIRLLTDNPAPARASAHDQDQTPHWRLPAEDAAPLIRLFGRMLATRLAWQSHQPPTEDWAVPGLPLLWVDDQPLHNAGGVRSLRGRGFLVHTARDTASALQALQDIEYAAVISDMGRPPDPQAGYTLLQALRDQHDSTPFIIFSREVQPEHHADSVRRGALGSTDDFEVLMGWLGRELLQRPAIKAA